MSSVPTAVSVMPWKKDRLSPGTKSCSYGNRPALHVICMASATNWASGSSGRARISSMVMPVWMALRYTWYTTRPIGIWRSTHSSCAFMIA